MALRVVVEKFVITIGSVGFSARLPDFIYLFIYLFIKCQSPCVSLPILKTRLDSDS